MAFGPCPLGGKTRLDSPGYDRYAGSMTYCEDYPCCGHTYDDPCAPQDYDRPGYYDTTIRGNEHALCDHENGDCDVDYDDVDPSDCSHADRSWSTDYDTDTVTSVDCDICGAEAIAWTTDEDVCPTNIVWPTEDDSPSVNEDAAMEFGLFGSEA